MRVTEPRQGLVAAHALTSIYIVFRIQIVMLGEWYSTQLCGGQNYHFRVLLRTHLSKPDPLGLPHVLVHFGRLHPAVTAPVKRSAPFVEQACSESDSTNTTQKQREHPGSRHRGGTIHPGQAERMAGLSSYLLDNEASLD